MRAVQEIKAEQSVEALKAWKIGDKVESREVVGDEAEAVADKPHLTGDPEWDAVELAETDAMREPFDDKRFR